MRHLLAVFLKIPDEHTRYFYMGVLPWNQCRIFLSGSHATLLARCRDKTSCVPKVTWRIKRRKSICISVNNKYSMGERGNFHFDRICFSCRASLLWRQFFSVFLFALHYRFFFNLLHLHYCFSKSRNNNYTDMHETEIRGDYVGSV